MLPHLHLTFQSLHWKEIMEDACAFSMSNFQIGFYLYIAHRVTILKDKIIQLSCFISVAPFLKQYLLGKDFHFLFLDWFCLKCSKNKVCSLIPARHVVCIEIIHAEELGRKVFALFLFLPLGKWLLVNIYKHPLTQSFTAGLWGSVCFLYHICDPNCAISCGYMGSWLGNLSFDLGHVSKKSYLLSCTLSKSIPLNTDWILF